MSTHAKAAAKFLADRERAAWHDRALYHVREKRDRMAHAVPEWAALRQVASEIALHTLSHLGRYLEEFERNATANGMVVHWASDAREMNRIVLDILRRHGGRTLIKSKSMLSEECGLAPFLAGQGIDAVESDLGERIMQLMHRPPSHIVLPAIHVRREEVGELFERELGTARGDSDPTYLTHEARKHLRGKVLTADVAMTGEITLRGRVTAIGGLKEKLLSALRGGIKTVIIPKENEKDLEEIPENVKTGMKIIPVSDVKEVIKIALKGKVKPLEEICRCEPVPKSCEQVSVPN